MDTKKTECTLKVPTQREIDNRVWHEFRRILRQKRINPIYVRSIADFQLCSIEVEAKSAIAGIMREKGLISSVIAVLPFVSGRVVVIGRAVDHWPVWQTSEDLQYVRAEAEDVEIDCSRVIKIKSLPALHVYFQAINKSRDNLRLVADFTGLAPALLCALGYHNSIALTAAPIAA